MHIFCCWIIWCFLC